MKTLYKLLPLWFLIGSVSCAQELPEEMSGDSSARMLPSLHPVGKHRELIQGTISYTPILKPDQWFSKKNAVPEYGRMVPGGEKLSLVAFGGGLTAGVMNGGLYREGQQFAYPNLVAHQMGLTDFQSPLFSENEANGTGFLIENNTHSDFPVWKRVTNNLVRETAGTPPSISPYVGKVNNYGLPDSQSDGPYSRWFPSGFHNFQPFLWRILPKEQNKSQTLMEYAKEQTKYNFVLYEDFTDDWMRSLLKIPDFSMWTFYGHVLNGQGIDESVLKAMFGGVNGVIFTIPKYQDLPMMNWYSIAKGNEKVQTAVKSFQASYIEDRTRPKYFLPTFSVDRLFRGESVTLTDADVITAYEESMSDPEWEFGNNIRIRKAAKANNIALVDLAVIYSSIHNSTYVTDDGLKIDGSRTGNFFSSDGIYPTPLGQAVIANEVIKAINTTYQAKIPLINVSRFAETIGVKK